MIEAALDLGHSAQRIFQDLVRDAQFTGSYDSVKRKRHAEHLYSVGSWPR